jgi:tetratricopeptide (TPR) repeat protein
MRPEYILFWLMAVPFAPAQSSGNGVSGNADELLRNGISAQQRHDYQTAIDDFRKALSLQPGLVEARANLGAALSEAGQFDEAIQEDIRALANAPDKNAVRMNMALAYYKKGDLANAQQQFEAVHAARPADMAAAVLLGYTDIKLGKNAEAVALLTPMEAGHESNMDFEYVLAYALIQSGKEALGMPRMEKVAKANHSADAFVIAGSARMRLGAHNEAREDLDAALMIDPNFPGAYTLAGKARDSMGDIEAAKSAFQSALKLDPMDVDANLYLGAIWLKQRDVDAARPLLELAMRLRPDSPQAGFQKAKLDSMTGNYAAAAAALEELVKADPNWLDPHVELATLYYKLHRPEDGQRERDTVARIEAGQQKLGPPKQP